MDKRQTVLITGASGDIGGETARAFYSAGYNVIINYNKNQAAAMQLQKSLVGGGRVMCQMCDVSNYNAVLQMYNNICSQFERVDVVVNNAGVALYKLFADCNATDFDSIVASNFKSVFNVCNIFSKDMVSNRYGRIVNVSSYYAIVGGSMETLYSATKAAVNGLTKALSRELAINGVTVNAVAPGLIDTKMNGRMSVADLAQFTETIPLGRMGTVQEVAETILFLASKKASYITGQIISTDGGLT